MKGIAIYTLAAALALAVASRTGCSEPTEPPHPPLRISPERDPGALPRLIQSGDLFPLISRGAAGSVPGPRHDSGPRPRRICCSPAAGPSAISCGRTREPKSCDLVAWALRSGPGGTWFSGIRPGALRERGPSWLRRAPGWRSSSTWYHWASMVADEFGTSESDHRFSNSWCSTSSMSKGSGTRWFGTTQPMGLPIKISSTGTDQRRKEPSPVETPIWH
jgi:hypothetical protein